MAVERKTIKDQAGSQEYDAVVDVFNLVKSGGDDHIFIDSTTDSFQIRLSGRTVILKDKDSGQLIKINIDRAALDAGAVKETLSFLDGDLSVILTKSKNKITAKLTNDADGSSQTIGRKLADITVNADDALGSGDHFGGTSGSTGTTLTEDTDTLTGNVFTSGLVYTPGGNDRVNALQDEDTLTGTGTNPTLNVTLGNHNDNGSSTVTPVLLGINTINVDFTGSTNTLDLRNADSITNLTINRITAAAGDSATIDHISQVTDTLTVENTSKALVDVSFNFADTVLDGTTVGTDPESGKVKVENVTLHQLHVGNDNSREGFETLEFTSVGTNTIKNFEAVDLENLTIKGSAATDVLNLLDTDSDDGVPGDQRVNFHPGNGIAIGDGLGIRSIDASTFTGTLNIDITNAVGGHTDPKNSGVRFYTDIKGGTGNDTFWAGSAVTGESATLHDSLDGGTGTNVLRAYSSVDGAAVIKNIQTVEIRESGAVVDIDAFDSTLTTVLMRDEHVPNGGVDITVKDVTDTLATSGNLILRHPQDGEGPTTPHIYLKDAAGTGANSETVVVTVQNDFNTEFQFNYILDIDGNQDLTGVALANQKVENVTIHDDDTESNVVDLLKADEHTGIITLDGGTQGKFYEVTSTLIAATVDASAQDSDLRLTVGTANQVIKLGKGDDILTFKNLDDFSTADTLSDAGGIDTLRAAFSRNVSGTPALAGIEKLHIAATQSMSMNLANATGITELAILSNQAVDGDTDASPITGEPFGITGVDASDIITLSNTNIDTLNFFGDNDKNDILGTDSGDHVFNGVNLASNGKTTLTVAINSSLDPDEGADSYTLGQLTIAGVTTATIAVGNEREIAAGAPASATVTTINNILATSLQQLTVTAQGTVNLGTVTGSGTKDNIQSITTTGVLGDFQANVVGLGTNAVVNLGNGHNDFDALGSSGNNVTINSGSSDDILGGTDQKDIIHAGAGDDVVNGYRGDNTLDAGSGDDSVVAQEGSDTYSMGSGTLESVKDNENTSRDGAGSTQTVTLEGSTVTVQIDINGNGAFEINQWMVGGDGTTETVRWDNTSNLINYGQSSLSGATAIRSNTQGATYNGDANANFVIAEDANVTQFNGQDGDDVFMVENAGTGNATARTFNGGGGNDAFVGSMAADDVSGGLGADRLVLLCNGSTNGDGAVDIVRYSVGDSTVAAGWDKVYGFEIDGGTNDQLDLPLTAIAGFAGFENGIDAGSGTAGVSAHSIDFDGLISFFNGNGDVRLVGERADQISLDNALAYLASNFDGDSVTVAFRYDRNGDGAADDTFVFQDGVQDTIVQLVGITADGLDTAASNGMIHLV